MTPQPPAARQDAGAAFTPGPWRADYAGGYGMCGFYSGTTLIGTAHQIGSGDDRIDIAEANARLASAAPELCEALIALAEFVDRHVNYVDADPLLTAAERAIRKARGETL